MTKDVLIKISGLQMLTDDNDESVPVEVITSGQYYCKNGKHYVLYDEVLEGFDGVTKNRIKIQDDCVDISKRGVSNVHMVFRKNKKSLTSYETPYGNMLIGIDAHKLQLDHSEDSIDIDIRYNLDINYEHVAECTVKMNIQSKASATFASES